ncbi:hypothetical protein OF83DRAFT_1155944 [Amylostereum chailletii]|nr:hypothetical protein OF83DRAFT_1155944 [Amylostereum chailletii]
MAYVVQALRPLPSLRSLDIHWNSNRDDPLPMSAAFSSPSLEHLGITGIMPSPAFPFLARLTSLSVTIIHVPTPNLRHPLEAVLRGTPQLRRFKLEQRFPGIIDVGPGPFILPDSVRDFELSYETPALCDFVDRIVVPASASVWVYPPHTATEPSKLHTLLKKNMFTGPSRLLLDDGTTVLEATSRDGCRERRQIGFGEASTERPRRILAVSLHAVRELCLAPLRCGERDTDLTKGTWGVILSRAPALVHIAVPAVCAMDVVMTLAWTLRMVQGEYSVLARGLEKVTILHGATAEGEEGEEDGDMRLDWESIERAREVRRELGCPFVVEEVSEDRVRPWVESWYDMDG